MRLPFAAYNVYSWFEKNEIEEAKELVWKAYERMFLAR